MGMSRYEREVRRLIKEYATFVRTSRHGDLWRIRGGGIVSCYRADDSATRSIRAWRNQLAEVRRACRAAGIITNMGNGSDTGPVEEDQVHQKPPMDDDERIHALTKLGAHFKESVVKITQTEVLEATVTPAVLVRALFGHESLDGEVKCHMIDPDGNPIAELLVVRMEITTERGT